jgi:hypothetical protein
VVVAIRLGAVVKREEILLYPTLARGRGLRTTMTSAENNPMDLSTIVVVLAALTVLPLAIATLPMVTAPIALGVAWLLDYGARRSGDGEGLSERAMTWTCCIVTVLAWVVLAGWLLTPLAALVIGLPVGLVAAVALALMDR